MTVKRKVGRRKQEVVSVPELTVVQAGPDEDADQKEAHKQEQRIIKSMKQGLEATLEVANAVAIFNERRLYRFTHDTFEAWGKEKLMLGRSRLYQLRDLNRLALNDPDFMSTAVDIGLTESALRPLAKMEDDAEQEKVCVELMEGEEEITPGRIKRVIQDTYPPEPKEKDHRPEYEEVSEMIHRYLGKFRDDGRVETCDMIVKAATALRLDAEGFKVIIDGMNQPLDMPPDDLVEAGEED